MVRKLFNYHSLHLSTSPSHFEALITAIILQIYIVLHSLGLFSYLRMLWISMSVVLCPRMKT
ncbi:hypothetical protein HD554DRAFT_2311977 [Boletus coccyginus]|nr:hypothetical protein HD554DRAFT_2311977 [Boletus coccyginus]